MENRRQLLYIIGQPGSGKTTLMQALTAPWRSGIISAAGGAFSYINYGNGCIQLGIDREDFGGTDGYPMNVQPKILDWLARQKVADIIWGEGDRLGNAKFFIEVLKLQYDLTLYWLDCPDVIAAPRRAARGSTQNMTWIKGRQTKVLNLVETFFAYVKRLDATRPVDELVSECKELRELYSVQTQHNY